jgi:hypothetical protein
MEDLFFLNYVTIPLICEREAHEYKPFTFDFPFRLTPVITDKWHMGFSHRNLPKDTA